MYLFRNNVLTYCKVIYLHVFKWTQRGEIFICGWGLRVKICG